MQSITEWHNVDADSFLQQILPLQQPALLRQAVRHWPAVQAALTSDRALRDYIAALDNKAEVNTVLAHPDTGGRLSYNADLSGLNFERQKAPLTAVFDELQRIANQPDALHIAVQSARADACLPQFSRYNAMPLLNAAAVPRIWLGNRIVVPAHFDDAHNLACVVAGQRRFTLFAPEQVANLYPGPLDFTPAGAPVSLVDVMQPDLQRYPKFATALKQAQYAELEPGDVLYIPALWWHHVQSLQPLNMLVNYWWGGSIADDASPVSPFDSLLHSLLTLQKVTPAQRQHWQALFNHWVFHANGDPAAHLPAQVDGKRSLFSGKRKPQLLQWLAKQLQLM
ncbi:cupin-like domain-containing protein [Rheinheimera nanhaiensis]|nr:cupin-like domain-containing protein [Rheinheimera nanhaiensis]